MTDNNKFTPKLPETKTEIVLNQEQQNSQEQKSITGNVAEAVKETIIPTAYASDSNEPNSNPIVKEQEEGAKEIIGGVSAATGGTASLPIKIMGKVEEGIGKASDNEEMKKIGEIHSEGASKPKE